jgi:hypothetical protein
LLVLGLIRRPVDLALSLAEGALDVSLAIVRAARGLVEEDQASTRWDVAEPQPRTAPAPEPPQRAATEEGLAPVVPPPPPPVEEHVSEEPVPVAEFAEPGAEDGASAELRVEEPWEGYSRQDARTVGRKLATASRETLAAVELYESTHKQRRSVMEPAERRLKELSGPAASRTR